MVLKRHEGTFNVDGDFMTAAAAGLRNNDSYWCISWDQAGLVLLGIPDQDLLGHSFTVYKNHILDLKK